MQELCPDVIQNMRWVFDQVFCPRASELVRISHAMRFKSLRNAIATVTQIEVADDSPTKCVVPSFARIVFGKNALSP